MGSNYVATFLTKLLRPDKKSKQKQTNDSKRRHSAPGPDWLDIFDVITNEGDGRKLPEQKDKHKLKYSSQQNLTTAKNRKTKKTKPDNSNGKRHSAAFPSWFCVSGNTDTLDRTPLPASSNANINKRNISNTQKSNNGGVPMKADFLRKGEGKRPGVNENRYSVPNLKSFDGREINLENPECSVKTQIPLTTKPRRDLSPPISYRYEGTLEKPYVFPAGLTFGPEGRKLQLRRTTSSQNSENHRNNHRPNDKIVKADVHMSSTEDILMEYVYEEGSPDNSEFDVRKAFYLKYDSNVKYPTDRQDSLDSRATNRGSHCEQDIRDSQLGKEATLNRNNHENRWKPKGSTANTTTDSGNRRSSKRIARAERSRNRYSMPPKNEDCVYMGSFEDVNMCNHLNIENQMSKSTLDISGNKTSSGSDNKRNRVYRYSLPPTNTDLVFMGSFENVNQLLTGDKHGTCNFSLPHDNAELDINTISHVNEGYNRSTPIVPDGSEKCTIRDDKNDKLVVRGNSYLTERGDPVDHSEIATHTARSEQIQGSLLRQKLKRHSSLDLTFGNNLSIANINQEHGYSELENEEDDLFDASSPFCERVRSWSQDNPFSRNTGRSSCMPGNKRSIAPPPAITNPSNFTAPAGRSLDSNSSISTFLPGNKRFSIPPPPNYTPPKEEMEFTYGHLKKMACHKGSQADLSVEFDNLNMEDRDYGLQRENVRTIVVSVSSLTVENNNEDLAASKNSSSTRDNIPFATRSSKAEPSGEQLDVSNSSQGSDEVFRDNQCFYNDVNEKVISSRCSKISATQSKSSRVESNHFAKFAPVSIGTDMVRKIDEETKCTSNVTKRKLNFSESSSKNASSGSRTSITSTPNENRHPQFNWPHDSLANIPQDKPVPHPRKLYGTADSRGYDAPFISTSQKNLQHTCTISRSRPIPKERHSLTYSRSLSSAEQYGKKPVSAQDPQEDVKKYNSQKLTRTHSCEHHGISQMNPNIVCSKVSTEADTENKLIKDENLYEAVDLRSSFSGRREMNRKDVYSTLSGQDDINHIHLYASLPGVTSDNIYDECRDIGSDKEYSDGNRTNNDNADRQEKGLLSPLQKIKLDASPGQIRRNRTRPDCSTTDMPPGQLAKHCGLASSLDDIFDRHRRDAYDVDNNSSNEKDNIYEIVDDNNSSADDEMSLSNEEEMEERVKQLSLRRCVSEDNLLRSGSILDRSMILAKRRRKRTRERRSNPQLSSSSDARGFMGYNKFSHLNLSNSGIDSSTKVHYNKRKTTNNERLYKHKASHTDSGHDSDMVSPCTSPDTGRHIDKITSLNYAHSAYDLIDSPVPRQGTLPKKPWEIRLRNTQYLRKSRSRESLLNLNLESRPVVGYIF